MDKSKPLGVKAMFSDRDRFCVDEGSVETSMIYDARTIHRGVTVW